MNAKIKRGGKDRERGRGTGMQRWRGGGLHGREGERQEKRGSKVERTEESSEADRVDIERKTKHSSRTMIRRNWLEISNENVDLEEKELHGGRYEWPDRIYICLVYLHKS